MKLTDAARLALKSYDPASLPGVTLSLTAHGAEAYLLADGTLVIPGTNDPDDWGAYNFQMTHARGAFCGWPAAVNGLIAKEKWLFGFALFAATLRQGLGTRRPKFVIGHSLGGAGAQLLGLHYRVPAVAFNAPSLHVGHPTLLNEGWVLNLYHQKDPVANLWGPASGLRHLGSRIVLGKTAVAGSQHAMAALLPVIEQAAANGAIPAAWPP